MLFSSATFLFMFLPATLFVYWLAPRGARNHVLLLASLLFYAWGEPRYLPLMLAVIAANWAGALAIGAARRGRRLWLALTIAANLGALFWFKYFNFAMENLRLLFSCDLEFVKVALPIGISFYTFQAMSYTVDVFRGIAPAERNPLKVALYVVLFPQLIAGPIVKYHDVAAQIGAREESFALAASGLRRFIAGLGKKMLVANAMGGAADKIFALDPAALPAATAWLGLAAYTLQIYFDFSGYSDMAIGLGRMFGFRFRENFNYPYVSQSITEFWRRWHISLSTWFKEYLYIPLGGNRVPRLRNLFNLSVVFLATGIWHGAEWTFVLWGVWHGLFIVGERMLPRVPSGLFGRAYALLAVMLGWLLFRAESVSQAAAYFVSMCGGGAAGAPGPGFCFGVWEWLMLAAGIAGATGLPLRAARRLERALPGWAFGAAAHAALLAVLAACVAAIAASTYNPFIYFRF